MPFQVAAQILHKSAQRHPRRESLIWIRNDGTRQSFTLLQAWQITIKLAEIFAQHTGITPTDPKLIPAPINGKLTQNDEARKISHKNFKKILAGPRIMIFGSNSPWHFLTHTGAGAIGAVSVPVPATSTIPELASYLRNCKPSIVIVAPELKPILRAAIETLNSNTPTNSIHTPTADPIETLSYDDLYRLTQQKMLTQNLKETTKNHPSDMPTFWHGFKKGASDLAAAIIYTSGTMSAPKGVVLTHSNLWWGSRNFRDAFEYSSQTICGVCAPMSHIGGFNGTALDIFSTGGTVVIFESFNPARLAKTLASEGIEMMFAVPTIYRKLLDELENWATANDPTSEHLTKEKPAGLFTRFLPRFSKALTGGAYLDPCLAKRLTSQGLYLYNVWGMSEQAASGTCTNPNMQTLKPDSVGTAFNYVQIRLNEIDQKSYKDLNLQSDKNQNQQEQDSRHAAPVGELWCKGPSVFHGYWDNPAANDQAFSGQWFRTKDLAYQGSDGCFYIQGRSEARINSGGEKILPLEVEQVISKHPRVKQVAIIGKPDPLWGQIVTAIVVPHKNQINPPVTLKELRDFARESLAGYKLPRALILTDSLPLNANGKLNLQLALHMHPTQII